MYDRGLKPPPPKLKFERSKLGSSTVSDGTIHLPKRLMNNYNLKKGDVLEFYPPTVDFPDEELSNLIAVLVRRKEATKTEATT